jgi:hypothetical protein
MERECLEIPALAPVNKISQRERRIVREGKTGRGLMKENKDAGAYGGSSGVRIGNQNMTVVAIKAVTDRKTFQQRYLEKKKQAKETKEGWRDHRGCVAPGADCCLRCEAFA